MTRIRLFAIIIAFCVDQITSSKCPNDVVSKFQTELNDAISARDWWSVSVDIKDVPDFALRIQLQRVPDREDIENALQCSSDDVYTGIELKDFELDLELKAKCGKVWKTKETMHGTFSHLDFTGGETPGSFKLSGIQSDIDFFAECKLTIFTSKESKNKKNDAIRKAIAKLVQEKLADAVKRRILDWGVCTKQTLQKYRGIFEDLANEWTDISHLDEFKASAANYVKSFRVKLEFAPTLETMAAGMYCDKAKNDFSQLVIGRNVNMAVLIEADPLEGSQKCKKKFEAKTKPLGIFVERLRNNQIDASISAVSLIVNHNEDCPLPDRGQSFWREGMQTELADRVTELITPCTAQATSKLSAELDKVFREGFRFANANGLATFSSDTKSATAIKMKCNLLGKLVGVSSLADLPVNLKLQLSTENCPGGESKEQTSSMQLPLRLSVGTKIQNIDVYNPKNSRVAVSSCASLKDQVKGFLVHDAFVNRIRDAVIEAVYATWKSCPPQIIEKLLAAFSGSSEVKTPDKTAKSKREMMIERLRKKRASGTQVKKFEGMAKEDYVIGCDVEKMPAKLTRFVTKDQSKTITATLSGEVSTSCTEQRQRPCSEAPTEGPCTGGCTVDRKSYGMKCFQTINDRICDGGYDGCRCKCWAKAECHNDMYKEDLGPPNGCKPRDENNPAATMAFPTKVKRTRAFSGTAALQFDFSKPGRRVDSSMSYSLQNAEGDFSGDCDPGYAPALRDHLHLLRVRMRDGGRPKVHATNKT